jgi:tetratricopeptide (TPR) repeat protein
MSDATAPQISVKQFEDFLTTVTTAVNSPIKDTPPAYTLILGAGFSNGLIPTAYEMAMNDIPWWLDTERDASLLFTRAPSYDDGFRQRRNALWRKIKEEQPRNKKIPDFKAGADGCPLDDADNIALCYKAIMCASAGLSSQESRCNYLRDAVKRTENEINYAHLFLAGLLQAQRTEAWKKELKHRRPFCRTVLTTNFDTLLQRSLQLNNQLFFISDQPESHFDAPDDGHDAIHIVQTHGSIFRPFVANDDEQIRRMREENAPAFTQYLESHGVIVIGYGGWDDTIMKALEDCKRFKGGLYWCDIHPEGAWDKLRSNVRALLEKHSGDAFYVPLRGKDGADYAMRDLHKSLGLKNYPKVLIDPLPNLIESIRGLHLPESLDEEKPRKKSDAEKCDIQSIGDLDNAKAVKDAVIKLLSEFQGEFTQPKMATGKMVLAYASAISSESEKSVTLWTDVAGMADASAELKTQALINRGLSKEENGDSESAMEDYTRVIEMSDAPTEKKAHALVNRGYIKMRIGDPKGAMEDWTRVIDMSDVSSEQKTKALYNRGLTKKENGDPKGAMEDWTRVIDMSDVSSEQKTKALYNRGLTKKENGDSKSAIEDYTSVIDMSDAPSEQKAKALFSRGLAKGRTGDSNGEIEDYTSIIEMPDAPLEQKAKALLNRGFSKWQGDDAEGAMEDCARVIEMPNAPAQRKTDALVNLGLAKEQAGDIKGAMEDYTCVIEMPDATSEQKAKALFNRGLAKMRNVDPKGAVEDYTRVIEMPDAPVEEKATALINRSLAMWRNGDAKREMEDYTRVIEMPDAPVGLKKMAQKFLDETQRSRKPPKA